MPINPRGHSQAPPSGLIAAGAFAATLFGTYLWVLMLAGPIDLATGLIDARDLLRKAERHLQQTAIKKAGYEVLGAQAAVRRARAAYRSDGPLLQIAAILPAIDRPLGEVDHLIAAAQHSADAALGTHVVAQTALRGPNKIVDKDEAGDTFIRLDRVEELSDLIAGVRADVDATFEELSRVDQDRVPRRVAAAIDDGMKKAAKTSKLLEDAQAGFAVLPPALGSEGRRTYLLAMQNPSELRGTGGSILRFALLSFDQGEPELLQPQSIYRVDVDRTVLDIPLPEDAWYVAGIEDARRSGNANWSPDWPLSANLTVEYAERSDELKDNVNLPTIDGVISLDPVVMQELLPGAGPVETQTGRRITSRKVVKFLLYEAYAIYPNTGIRRAVLRQIVENFYENMVKPSHPTALIEGFSRSLARKHMQVWFADPDSQSFIERMNWDGAIEQEPTDYFSVVEQNVGGNKLNYFEQQEHSLDIEVVEDDVLVDAAVRVFNGVFAPQPRYLVGDSGDDKPVWRGFLHLPMINVYVPEDAVFESVAVEGVERLDVPSPALWPSADRPAEHLELDKRVWTATLKIPAQSQGELRYRYQVPRVVVTESGRRVYRLTVQHQPKIQPETLTIRLQLPPGASAIRAPGWQRRNGVLMWDRSVDRDITLEVSWRE